MSLGRVGSLADDDDVAVSLQQSSIAFAHDGVIVHQQHRDSSVLAARHDRYFPCAGR